MSLRDSRNRVWAEALELIERADRLHRQFFRLGRAESCQPTWEPPVDMFATDHEVVVLVALPGVPPDHAEILMDGGAVVVRGVRPLPSPQGSMIHRLEIPYGRFECRVALPAGQLQFRDRRLADGLLHLYFRKLA